MEDTRSLVELVCPYVPHPSNVVGGVPCANGVEGEQMLAAFVIVPFSIKVVVPVGATHTSFVASPELTIVTVPPPALVTFDAKTVF